MNYYDNIKEKTLQGLILEDINKFLRQLGSGYSYVQDEYKIKIGDTYNYIDYNLKGLNDNKTIGLIVVKENNNYIIKYSSDKRILSRKYILEA